MSANITLIWPVYCDKADDSRLSDWAVGGLRKASETPNTANEDDSYHTGPCKEPNNAISRLL